MSDEELQAKVEQTAVSSIRPNDKLRIKASADNGEITAMIGDLCE